MQKTPIHDVCWDINEIAWSIARRTQPWIISNFDVGHSVGVASY